MGAHLEWARPLAFVVALLGVACGAVDASGKVAVKLVVMDDDGELQSFALADSVELKGSCEYDSSTYRRVHNLRCAQGIPIELRYAVEGIGDRNWRHNIVASREQQLLIIRLEKSTHVDTDKPPIPWPSKMLLPQNFCESPGHLVWVKLQRINSTVGELRSAENGCRVSLAGLVAGQYMATVLIDSHPLAVAIVWLKQFGQQAEAAPRFVTLE